ncbi:hypothetical protein O9992_26000 [Vibrio lentus]|nr:hypothetical protein [Vibrio lentus]
MSYSHIKSHGWGDKDSYSDIALKKQGHKRRIALQVPFFSSAKRVNAKTTMIVPEHIAYNRVDISMSRTFAAV